MYRNVFLNLGMRDAQVVQGAHKRRPYGLGGATNTGAKGKSAMRSALDAITSGNKQTLNVSKNFSICNKYKKEGSNQGCLI